MNIINGELDKVTEYCKADMDITRLDYQFGKDNGYVNYCSKLGSKLKVAVNWNIKGEINGKGKS